MQACTRRPPSSLLSESSSETGKVRFEHDDSLFEHHPLLSFSRPVSYHLAGQAVGWKGAHLIQGILHVALFKIVLCSAEPRFIPFFFRQATLWGFRDVAEQVADKGTKHTATLRHQCSTSTLCGHAFKPMPKFRNGWYPFRSCDILKCSGGSIDDRVVLARRLQCPQLFPERLLRLECFLKREDSNRELVDEMSSHGSLISISEDPLQSLYLCLHHLHAAHTRGGLLREIDDHLTHRLSACLLRTLLVHHACLFELQFLVGFNVVLFYLQNALVLHAFGLLYLVDGGSVLSIFSLSCGFEQLFLPVQLFIQEEQHTYSFSLLILYHFLSELAFALDEGIVGVDQLLLRFFNSHSCDRCRGRSRGGGGRCSLLHLFRVRLFLFLFFRCGRHFLLHNFYLLYGSFHFHFYFLLFFFYLLLFLHGLLYLFCSLLFLLYFSLNRLNLLLFYVIFYLLICHYLGCG
mmetsp:Transcript_43294/g.112514  ORF Transcript_43294/g.112514 Transcript_43294/m.112514 type:complete len:461 (+) Transcript_43294:133-1515(+)